MTIEAKTNFKKVTIKYDEEGSRGWLENEEGKTICNFFFNQNSFDCADANIKEIARRVNEFVEPENA